MVGSAPGVIRAATSEKFDRVPTEGIEPNTTSYILKEIAREAHRQLDPKGLFTFKEFSLRFSARCLPLFSDKAASRLASLEGLTADEIIVDPLKGYAVSRLLKHDPSSEVRARALDLTIDAYLQLCDDGASDKELNSRKAQILGDIVSGISDESPAIARDRALRFLGGSKSRNCGALLAEFVVQEPDGRCTSGPAVLLEVAGRLVTKRLGPTLGHAATESSDNDVDSIRKAAIALVSNTLETLPPRENYFAFIALRRMLNFGNFAEDGPEALAELINQTGKHLNHPAVSQYFAQRLEDDEEPIKLAILSQIESFLMPGESEKELDLSHPGWSHIRAAMGALANSPPLPDVDEAQGSEKSALHSHVTSKAAELFRILSDIELPQFESMPGNGVVPRNTISILPEIVQEARWQLDPIGILSTREFELNFTEKCGDLFAERSSQQLAALGRLKSEDLKFDSMVAFSVSRLFRYDQSPEVRQLALKLLIDTYSSLAPSNKHRHEILGDIVSAVSAGIPAIAEAALNFFDSPRGAKALTTAYTIEQPDGRTTSGPAAVLELAARLVENRIGPVHGNLTPEDVKAVEKLRARTISIIGKVLADPQFEKRSLEQEGEVVTVELKPRTLLLTERESLVLALRRVLHPDSIRSEFGPEALEELIRVSGRELGHKAIAHYFALRLEHGASEVRLALIEACSVFLTSERAREMKFSQGIWLPIQRILQNIVERNGHLSGEIDISATSLPMPREDGAAPADETIEVRITRRAQDVLRELGKLGAANITGTEGSLLS